MLKRRFAGALHRDGYLEVRDTGDGLTFYTLTAQGAAYTLSVAARGT